jgi:triphosphatase
MPHDATTELELKLRLPAAAAGENIFVQPPLADLLSELPSDERLEAWYFDTADGALRQSGLAYRIRLEGGRWVATVKADKAAAGGLHERREWNVVIEQPEATIDHFAATEAGPLLTEAAEDSPLVRQFATIFDRRKANVVTADGSIIEAAFDRGDIVADDRTEAIAEIELELKNGHPSAVLALGAELAGCLPVMVETRSKYARALVLAGLAAAATGPRFTPPDAATPADEALGKMLTSQLILALAAYEDFRRNTADPEFVHRLRVQLRRLRSLLAFAKPLVDPLAYENWQNRLQTLSRALNNLRETDVAIATWQALTAGDRLTLTPPPWLGLLLADERGRLASKTALALEEARLTAVLLSFWAFIATDGSLQPADDQPLAEFAADRLADWLAAMKEAGKNLDWDDVPRLHQMRIQGKKIRYVLESLPPQGRKTKLLILRLKELQDYLGQRVDTLTIAQAMESWMSQHASRVVHRDAGLVIGWSVRQGIEAGQGFERAWRRWRRAARRWLKDAKDD